MNELKEKIRECEELHQELKNRPLGIKASAEIVDLEYKNYKSTLNRLRELLSKNSSFAVKLVFGGEALWAIVVKEYHNELFLAVLDNTPVVENLKFRDLVEFTAVDVLEFIVLRD